MFEIIHSIKWNFIGNITIQLLKLFVIIILTRILLPEDFGLLALCLSIIGFARLFNDFGLGSSLIQKQNITNDDISFIFTIQLLLGCFLTSLIFFSSVLFAKIFSDEELEFLIKFLSFTFVIQSIGLVSYSLMKKNFEFKKIQLIQLSSYIISYIFIAIPLALNNYGVWSLAIAQVIQVSIQSILYFIFQKHSFKLSLNYHKSKSLLSFSIKSLLNNILSYSIDNISVFFIGYFLNTRLLGFFNRSLTLLKMPMDVITSSFQSVLFSKFSKTQNLDFVKKKRNFLFSINLISFIIFPIFSVIAVIPDTFIATVIGVKWLEHSNILLLLAIAMPINTLLAIPGTIMWGDNVGEKEIKAQFYALFSILIMYSLYYLSFENWTIYQVSFLVLTSFILRLIFINQKLFSYINCTWNEYFLVLFKPISFSIILATVIHLIDHYTYTIFNSYYICFLVDLLSSISLILIMIFFNINFFINYEIKLYLKNYESKIPVIFRKKIWKEI